MLYGVQNVAKQFQTRLFQVYPLYGGNLPTS